MSKVAIVGDPSGTGTFTISAPNGNTDRTLVLPDEAGTVLTSAGVPASAMPAGSVIQVVSSTSYVGATSTTSTRADTGLSLSITPTSTTSKILVSVHCNGTGKNGGNTYEAFWLMRDSTDLTKFAGEIGYTADTSVSSTASASVNYLDTPNTTSSVTYKVQFANGANTGFVGIGKSSSQSSITLMEIAA